MSINGVDLIEPVPTVASAENWFNQINAIDTINQMDSVLYNEPFLASATAAT